MNVYKLHINDRNYTSWEIFDTIHFQKVDISINPIESKMFSNDVFTVDSDKNVTVLHSSIKTSHDIPCVLMLSGNKTYGRRKGRLLYKCVPDDMRLPPFLVPYEIKQVGFSKVFINLYAAITFIEWTDKHPIASLSKIIGPVNELDNFYEYQLYCKSLNASIQKFQKATCKALELNTIDAFIENIKIKHPSIEDRRPTTTDNAYTQIFTIDPPNCLDFDDAFSICDCEDGTQRLTIYISNVTIWMDVLDIWDSFSRRISTIYLPDKKRPMLPTILSDSLCSLQAGVTRIAFYMDIFIKDGDVVDLKYGNCFIKVIKNYCYEEKPLVKDPHYLKVLEATKMLSKKYKYINSVKNSHDVVTYLMTFMNCHSAKQLMEHNTGIFRSTITQKHSPIPETVPEDVSKFIKIWKSAHGQYVNGADITNRRHELLDMDAYIHITSPIRRLVDLLNIIKFQQITNIIQLSENAMAFYDNWLNDLEYINLTMRSIRKVQCDCTLLDLCSNNPDILTKEYDGYIFDKIIRTDGLFQYIVFLPDLKLSSRITSREDIANFEARKFQLYIFHNEEKFKQKIRLHLV
jgi:hypothetical protein